MQSEDSIPKIPDKATTNEVLNDLRELFKPILARLSTDQRKTLAEIDQHIFPLVATNLEEVKLKNSVLVDTLPKKGIRKHTDSLDNLFCIPLNHKQQLYADKKGDYDEELYY